MPKARSLDEQLSNLEATRRRGVSRLIARENLKLARSTFARGKKHDAQAYAHLLVAQVQASNLLTAEQMKEAAAIARDLMDLVSKAGEAEPTVEVEEDDSIGAAEAQG